MGAARPELQQDGLVYDIMAILCVYLYVLLGVLYYIYYIDVLVIYIYIITYLLQSILLYPNYNLNTITSIFLYTYKVSINIQ